MDNNYSVTECHCRRCQAQEEGLKDADSLRKVFCALETAGRVCEYVTEPQSQMNATQR